MTLYSSHQTKLTEDEKEASVSNYPTNSTAPDSNLTQTKIKVFFVVCKRVNDYIQKEVKEVVFAKQ